MSHRRRVELRSEKRKAFYRSAAIWVSTIIPIVILFGALAGMAGKAKVELVKEDLQTTMSAFLNEVKNIINAPDFQLYPWNVRLRFLAVASQIQNEVLFIEMNTSSNKTWPQAVMVSDPAAPEMKIRVNATKYRGLKRTLSPEMLDHTIMVWLIQERLRLERWPQTYALTAEETIQKDMTLAIRTNLAVVRPLRQNRIAVPDEFIRLDEILKACNDELPCPDLRQEITSRYTH